MVRALFSAFLVLVALRASADVTFSGTFYNTPSNPNGVVSADLDRDGLPDMAITSGNTVSVYLAPSAGNFGAEKDYKFFGNSALDSLLAADFNGDGALDLIVEERGRAQLAILWNNGDGTFRAGPIVKVGAPLVSFDVGDFNHDGILDIATIECTSGTTVLCSMNSYKGQGKG